MVKARGVHRQSLSWHSGPLRLEDVVQWSLWLGMQGLWLGKGIPRPLN